MALLNYIAKYENLAGKNLSDQALVFTGDGHIITHGVDYIGNVYNHINNLLASNDAMVFKGVVSSNDDLPKNGYSAGWTYRVQKGGTYAEKTCEIGDLIIAIQDAGADQSTVEGSHWAVIQSNINGTAKLKVNSSERSFYTDKVGDDIKFYAPTTLGSNTDILVGGGTAPSWLSMANLHVGSASSADKLINSLSLGLGLSFKDNATGFDGSSAVKILLNIATKDNIGGVIIGDNITVGTDGKISISVVSDSANGVMTPELLAQLNTNTTNIATNTGEINNLKELVNALSGNVNNLNFFNTLKVSETELSAAELSNLIWIKGSAVSYDSSNKAVVFTDTKYTFSNSAKNNTFEVTPSGGTTQEITIAPNIVNNVIYSGSLTVDNIPVFDTTTGTIKDSGSSITSILNTLSTLNYFSSVTVGNTTINASGSTTLNITGNAVSAANNTITITDTWRPIYLETETDSIPSNKALRFKSGNGLVIAVDDSNTNEYEVAIDLRWYNLDNESYE